MTNLKSGSGDWAEWTRDDVGTCTRDFGVCLYIFFFSYTLPNPTNRNMSASEDYKSSSSSEKREQETESDEMEVFEQYRPYNGRAARTTKTQKLTKMDFPQRFFVLRICDPRTTQHTRDLPNLSYDCDPVKHLVFWHYFCRRSFEVKDYWTVRSRPEELFTCTFTECVTNITKYMSFGILLEMCSRVNSRLNFTRESSFKGNPPHLAGLLRRLDFLSHNYCEQNKTVRSESTNGVIISNKSISE